ncbi:hypothetical protein Bbelb_381640 [Branchiostoma belcheri]|nr:hypothetical protein Bbelb_381640 [Branchiostoma belcheri]
MWGTTRSGCQMNWKPSQATPSPTVSNRHAPRNRPAHHAVQRLQHRQTMEKHHWNNSSPSQNISTQPLQFVTPFPIKRLQEVKDSVERAREMARLTAEMHSYWLNFFIRLEEYVPPEEEASPLSAFLPFS